MTYKETKQILGQLEKRELTNLDKAFGVIHEIFPEIYGDCDFYLLQRANSEELHRRSLARKY